MVKGKTKWTVIGILSFLVLSTAVYINFNDQAQIEIDDGSTAFYILSGNTKILAGKEINVLFDSNFVQYEIDKSSIKKNFKQGKITRTQNYVNTKCTITDNYVFDQDNNLIELFPLNHYITLHDCDGFTYKYTVTNLTLLHEGKNNVSSPQKFGHKMVVEWSGNYSNADILNGSLIVTYNINSDNYFIENRLFDPNPIVNPSFEDVIGAEWVSYSTVAGFGARRLAPIYWTPTDGTYAYILGNDSNYAYGDLIEPVVGDYVQVTQPDMNFTGYSKLYFDTKWEVYYSGSNFFNISVMVDNDVVWSRWDTDYELINKTKKAVEYFAGKYKIEDWEELNKRIKEYKGGMIARD